MIGALSTSGQVKASKALQLRTGVKGMLPGLGALSFSVHDIKQRTAKRYGYPWNVDFFIKGKCSAILLVVSAALYVDI